MPSRNAVYQRCISTQVQTKLSQRRKQELPPKSYHGPWDRRRLIQPEQDESPELRRRGGILVAQCMSHRVVQQSRNAEVNTHTHTHTNLHAQHSSRLLSAGTIVLLSGCQYSIVYTVFYHVVLLAFRSSRAILIQKCLT